MSNQETKSCICTKKNPNLRFVLIKKILGGGKYYTLSFYQIVLVINVS